jgi:hypothetical protein
MCTNIQAAFLRAVSNSLSSAFESPLLVTPAGLGQEQAVTGRKMLADLLGARAGWRSDRRRVHYGVQVIALADRRDAAVS